MSLEQVSEEPIEEIIEEPPEFVGLPIPLSEDPEIIEFNKKIELIKSSASIPIEKSISNQFDKLGSDLLTRDLEKKLEQAPPSSFPLIVILYDIVGNAMSDYTVLHSPNFTGHMQDDRAIKVRIRHFLKGRRGLKSGIEIYTLRIGQCLDGLVRFARFSKNMFGANDINLKVALRNYSLLQKQINESKDPYQKAEFLHGILVATQILFEEQAKVIREEDVTPIVSSQVDIGTDEFGMGNENYG